MGTISIRKGHVMWRHLRIIILFLSSVAGYISNLYINRHPIFFRQNENGWAIIFFSVVLIIMLIGPWIMAYIYKWRLEKGFLKPLNSSIWHSSFIISDNPLPLFHIGGMISTSFGLSRMAGLYFRGQQGWDISHLILLAGVSTFAFVYISLFLTQKLSKTFTDKE